MIYKMGLFISDNGFINYIRSGYNLSHTHGNSGNEELHKNEIEEIVNDITNQKLKSFSAEIEKTIETVVNQNIKSICQGVFQGLQRDVSITAAVSLDTAGEIYRKEEVKRIISNEILKQVLNELNKSKYINLLHR